MRSADAATIIRTLIVFVIAYMVLAKFSAIATIILIAVMYALDGFDGYLAVHEISNGTVGFIDYMRSALGNRKIRERVKKLKHKISVSNAYGARFDVAGDRVIEYTFWILFTYLSIIPLFVLLLVVLRHSFADALMASRGTSSKMRSRFAAIVYSSNASRALINILKFLAFAYLVLVYVSSYPILPGYILVGALFTMIMLRGIAEIYESTTPQRR